MNYVETNQTLTTFLVKLWNVISAQMQNLS